MARLRELEQLGAARAAVLREHEPTPAQPGLLFRLAGQALLAPMTQLVGVEPAPRTLTAVPGSARWVLGICNHRGALLPLYDLRGLLLGDYEGIQRRGFALLVPGRTGIFGAVVDAVVGLRRTRWQPIAAAEEPTSEPVAALLLGYCGEDAENAAVIDLVRLEQLPAFQQNRTRHSAAA